MINTPDSPGQNLSICPDFHGNWSWLFTAGACGLIKLKFSAWLHWSEIFGGVGSLEDHLPHSWAEAADKKGLIFYESGFFFFFLFAAFCVQACLLSTSQSLRCLEVPVAPQTMERASLCLVNNRVSELVTQITPLSPRRAKSQCLSPSGILSAVPPAAAPEAGLPCGLEQSGCRFSMRTRPPTPTWCKSFRTGGG